MFDVLVELPAIFERDRDTHPIFGDGRVDGGGDPAAQCYDCRVANRRIAELRLGHSPVDEGRGYREKRGGVDRGKIPVWNEIRAHGTGFGLRDLGYRRRIFESGATMRFDGAGIV